MADELHVIIFGAPLWSSRLREHLRAIGLAHVTTFDVASPVAGLRDLLRRRSTPVVLLRVGYRPGASTWRGRAADGLAALHRALPGDRREAFYWIGTDVLDAARDGSARSRTRLAATTDGLHLAAAEWLLPELARLGIQARCALFPVRHCSAPTEGFPDGVRLLTYIPVGRERFYGLAHVEALVDAFPDLEIDVMGHDGAGLGISGHPRVCFHGRVTDPTPLYQAATFVLRAVEHDAFGATVREGLAFARHVIYTYPVPNCELIAFERPQDTVAVVGALLDQKRTGRLAVNETGRRWVEEELDADRLSVAIAGHLRDAT